MRELYDRLMEFLASHPLRWVRRFVVTLIGVTVLLVGVAMMVLPGPAFIVIPAGLAILATEFVWARRLLKRIKDSLPLGGDSRYIDITPGEKKPERSEM